MRKSVIPYILASVLIAGVVQTSSAALVLSVEAPNVFTSKLPDTSVVANFDSAALLGPVSSLEISPGATLNNGNVLVSDIYGGANQARFNGTNPNGTGGYYSVQDPVGVLTFDNDQTYFGLWISAISSADYVQFYLDGNPLTDGKFETLEQYLTAPGYEGPNGQKVAFFNFTATAGTLFDEVRFTGNTLEADNFTLLSPVPETSTMMTMGGLLGAGSFFRRRSPRK